MLVHALVHHQGIADLQLGMVQQFPAPQPVLCWVLRCGSAVFKDSGTLYVVKKCALHSVLAQGIAVMRDRLWHSKTYSIGKPAALGHQGQAVCQCSLGLIRQGTSSKQGKG